MSTKKWRNCSGGLRGKFLVSPGCLLHKNLDRLGLAQVILNLIDIFPLVNAGHTGGERI
ncbi:MAG: hypothetical protein G3M70_16395 [Candidatus Nitronauta litoralis]|uniref:Uncharacterized protein n=1 Tax=Candidatus Nitronauta litoralis TaxID=2705533 RepID=A0A7T0BYS1_9BACT|nr:MAG: hypothetical protein G3M70_16395 [Candidatus Nitronauta litoralis]